MTRILVSNPAHIGDVILSTSVLPVLRKAYPKAELGMIVGSWAAPVVENHLYLDHIHYFDHPLHNRTSSRKAKKRRGAKLWKKALLELREINYDIAFEMYSLYRTNLSKLFYLADIPSRVGFWFSPTRQCFNHHVFWCDIWAPPEEQHLVKIHGQLLKGFGIEDLSLLSPTLEYKNGVKAPILPLQYIVIHVGVGEKRREWNQKAWRDLSVLMDQLGIPLLFIGKGQKERTLLEEITKGLKNGVNLSDAYSWRELVEVIGGATLLVGLESMAGHVAAAKNCPSVMIYGGNAKISRWRPYSSLSTIVSPDPTWFEEDRAPPEAIHSITAEKVFEKVLSVLSCKKEKELAIL